MANKYPYVSSAGPLIKAIDHLRRRNFPREVTAETLRKLGVAPKNESYVINVLQFLGIIDDEGKKVDDKAKAFNQHKDEEFQKEFKLLVQEAYGELFELNGDDTWKMNRVNLTQFFRTSDHSSEIVGTRQASTFTHLVALSGYSELPQARESTKRKSGGGNTKKNFRSEDKASTTMVKVSSEPQVGLTVRIEVNLPAEGDQEVYDRIFQSIRKNLIDGG